MAFTITANLTSINMVWYSYTMSQSRAVACQHPRRQPWCHHVSRSPVWIQLRSKTTGRFQIFLLCLKSSRSSSWHSSLTTWPPTTCSQNISPGFRKYHSTETAILRVFSDIYSAIDQDQVSLLTLLDVSAAFDTVDHGILLQRLSTSYGLTGTAFTWLESYITGRVQVIHVGGRQSSSAMVHFGVPQGSVLGPVLYVLYTADIVGLVETFGLRVHLYADDVQLYGCCRPSASVDLSTKVLQAIDSIHAWMFVKSSLTQHWEDAVHVVWYTEWSCQTWHASTFQPISFAGRTYRCQESWLHTRPGTLHEGPCLEVVPVMLLPAVPNSYDSALIVAIRHSYLSARLYLFTHRLLKQPPLRDEHVSSRSSSVGLELLSASDTETRKIRPDLSRHPTRPSLAANPSSYTLQDERHHKEIVLWVKLQSTWPSSAVPSMKSRRDATYDRRHKFGSWSLVFVRSVPVDVGFSISSPQLWNLLPVDIRTLYEEPNLFRKRLKTHFMQQPHLSPLRIYVTSATSTTTMKDGRWVS